MAPNAVSVCVSRSCVRLVVDRCLRRRRGHVLEARGDNNACFRGGGVPETNGVNLLILSVASLALVCVYLLGLLAMIKCSICSFQCDN